MIRVSTDGQRAGALDRLGARGSTFAYEPGAPAARAVSVTMPMRVQSWDTDFGLAPIFEMNLPEGALRERLTRRFAKATGTFDDFDLLGVIGRNQIGRVRFSAEGQDLNENLPFQSIDEILRARRGGGLFDYLLSTFAEQSGISGVQPKVMIRASGKASDPKGRQSPSVMSATHIVKLWDANEYPELAANESFCLQAAAKLGLPVPHFELSDDGAALVIDRFDLAGHDYLGFEDFCVLNGLGTANKYKGSYETRVFKRAKEFLPQHNITDDLKQLFKLIVLNCAIRNGDAHLKNFGLIYDEIEADLRLAPRRPSRRHGNDTGRLRPRHAMTCVRVMAWRLHRGAYEARTRSIAARGHVRRFDDGPCAARRDLQSVSERAVGLLSPRYRAATTRRLRHRRRI